MNVKGKLFPMEAGTILMLEPAEKHAVASEDSKQDLQWVRFKARATPDSKHIAEE